MKSIRHKTAPQQRKIEGETNRTSSEVISIEGEAGRIASKVRKITAESQGNNPLRPSGHLPLKGEAYTFGFSV
jgi:hypothetical protein